MNRSEIMARIKSKNTNPELAAFRALRRIGLRFKKHDRLRPGTPDISFPRKKVAVFVHGEFWHGRGKLPKVNQEFWTAKFKRNVERDLQVSRQLEELGWKVVVVWGKDALRDPDGVALRIKQEIETLGRATMEAHHD